MKRTQNFRTCSAVFVLFLIWEVIALWMKNDWLIPYPMDVLSTMAHQMASTSFYEMISYTLLRSSMGLAFAFILALITSYMSYQHKTFRDLFYPVLLLTRSVPNISYIIIILVLFSRESSVAIICFLILFPMLHSNLYSGFQHIDANLKNVLRIYPESLSYRIRHVYLPLLRGFIESSISNGISLAFKVGVMAEIIGQVQYGIGRQLNLCRISFDMTGIFAWTGWIIFLLVMLESIIKIICSQKKRSRE